MKRRFAAIVRTTQGARIVAATWDGHRLSDVSTTTGPCDAAAFGRIRVPAGTPIAIVLPSTEAGHRIVTLPAARRREVDAAVALETRGALPSDPGPLHVVRGTITDDTPPSTRAAVSFVRSQTLRAAQEELAAAGVTTHRIDAAPMPVWALIATRRGTALVVRDASGAWVASVDAAGAPRFARPLHAPANDPAAIAREVARTLAAWQVRPDRIVLAGPGTDMWSAAIARESGVVTHPLERPPDVDATLADDPLAAGAILALARRMELPLALLAPEVLPARRRRRIAGLAAVATLLLVAQGVFIRLDLLRRLHALENGVTTIVQHAGPRAAERFERLDAVAESPDLPIDDPALTRLYEIVSHVPALPLALHRLQLDSSRVALAGSVPSFDAVESLRRGLAASTRITDVRIAEMRAGVDDDVEFRLEGRWLRPGEQPS